MKKMLSMILALAMALSAGLIAQAETASERPINPQQRGHVFYLQSRYGEDAAARILAEYVESAPAGYQRQAPITGDTLRTVVANTQPDAIPYTGPMIIPQPSSTTSQTQLAALNVGDVFTISGHAYQVGRFAVVAGSNVLVGFPLTAGGYAQVSQPRYFYL